jgi:CheY-like chemotaxis protein
MSRLPPRTRRPGRPPASERDLDADWSRAEAPRPAGETAAGVTHRRGALTTASHEIRTPLAAIVGLADLLAAETLTPAQAALVRAIGISGRGLLSLVDDLLDVSRADLGRLGLTPEPTAPRALLEDVVELIAPRAHAKGLELALSLTGPLPAEVTVDAGRLRQVLMNLVGNAVKFTANGGVELAVVAHARRRGLARLDISVSDTGPGIAEADQARVFAAFEQAGDAQPGRRDGVGLGLAIARGIVEAMGGVLRLDSTLGKGARFAFTLDLPASPPAAPATADLAGRAVLALSPGRFEPAAWRHALAAAGATMEHAETVWDARRALATRAFDLMLIDHSATGDAVAMLADIGPERPPALVVLGPADRGGLKRFLAAGFAGHLVKPIRQAAFTRVLGPVLAARPVEAADPAAPSVARLPLAVLVVEDDEISALLARTLLLHLGARVDVVGDGAAALAAWRTATAEAAPYDMILIDQHLPGLDGPETIAALRAEAGAERARIVAVTADPEVLAADIARAAGADACLVKPLDADALVAAAGGAHAD